MLGNDNKADQLDAVNISRALHRCYADVGCHSRWQNDPVRWRLVSAGLAILVSIGCVAGGEQDAGEPVIGRQGVLARGTVPDTNLNWTLSATIDGDSLCLEFLGMSCIAIPEDELQQAQLGSFGVGPQRSHSCSYGPLFREVSMVQVEFTDGTTTNGRIIPRQGWATNFYVACIGRATDVRQVTLLDADGARLEPAS